MKYAFNTASAPTLTLPELLETARRYGYGGLEVRAGVGHRHGIEIDAGTEARQSLRRLAEKAKVALTALGVSSRFSAAEEEGEAQIDAAEKAIELAADMGIPYVRLFCGRIAAGDSRDKARERIVEALRRLAPSGTEHGVVLLLETHDDWSAPGELAEVLRRVGHPSVAALWDVLHTQHEGEASPAETVAALGPWIRHVHVHDGVRKPPGSTGHPHYRAIGSGDVDHAEVIRALNGIGYTGWLSGEWYEWEPRETHLPRELEALRRAEQAAGKGASEDGL